ncbi:hypothetical protein ACFTWS_18995 [Streptomyces sp. NPDC057027]|uniref:hypothetical protein n=1 Tax=Streptomyces sp. NPDC057027 TaxID=3346004 RepID=UPI00362B7430
MNKRAVSLAASIAAGLTLSLTAPAIASAETVPTDPPAATWEDLSPEQQSSLQNTPAPDADQDLDVEPTGPSSVIGADGQVAYYASTYCKTPSYYRGSSLMWTRDYVRFCYTGGAVTSSSGWQTRGYIFPNVAKNAGISRYYATSSTHKYQAKNTIGAGIVTPWGAVTLYEKDFLHYFTGGKTGSWSWTAAY